MGKGEKMVKSEIKVLLVEDSPSDAKLIKHELGEDQVYSFEVIWVSRVDKAIAELKRQQFDVALLDLSLPDSEGLATFTQIHATCPQELSIIIFTGTGDEQIGIKAIGLGAQDYLVKGITDGKYITRAIRYAIERKKAEMALILSEEKFATAFETNPAAITLTRLEDGLFLDVNDAWVSLNGYSRDEVIGQSGRKLPIWPTAEAANLFVQELREKGALRGWEQKFLNKSGEVFVTQLSAQLITIRGESVILSTMVDITARKQAEAELSESEHRLSRTQEIAHLGSWELDLQSKRLFWSDEVYRIYGLQPQEFGVTYEAFMEIVHPADRAAVDAAYLSSVRESRDLYESEHRVVRKSTGEIRTVHEKCEHIRDASGQIIRSVGMVQDITERKKMEEALEKSRDELELRVEERTIELKKALSEIEAMKDRLEAENIYFRQENKMKHQFENIIGQSDGLTYVLYRAQQVASMNTTVLILGETGTGKELIAAAIHNMSTRKERPLITVNCAALPGNLIESELFGREKGAFTGADVRRMGRFEVANGSTLCLDEIGELPLELQGKLLRVIQHNEFERLGSSQTIKVDVRIVATTNRNLEEEVRNGRFRQDLYYRLNVFPITIPPLRQRKDDIMPLVHAFTERYSRKMGKQITSIQKETMKMLQDYPWPGNIRELENIIERAVILCPGPVLELVDKLGTSSCEFSSTVKTLDETERNQILKILSETKWRIEGKDGAATILGVNPSTLRAKMHKFEIVRPQTKE